MKQLFIFAALFLSVEISAQNVGVGTAAPTEKLDVNGNINVAGTIKANGVDGTANQVLMKNNSGALAWGNINEYKNYETFSTTGTSSWTVPAGVTKIFVEAWGAGGGGSGYGGGGGGGYVAAYFTVVPGGSVAYTVGNNGSGGNDAVGSASSGGLSSVVVSGITLIANGGRASETYDLTPVGIFGGSGGAYSVSPITFKNFLGIPGEDGQPNQLQYFQSNSTTYLEITLGGKGGNAGNTIHTGGAGVYTMYNVGSSSRLRYISPAGANEPGGGGGGNYTASSASGSPGADGMVRIYY